MWVVVLLSDLLVCYKRSYTQCNEICFGFSCIITSILWFSCLQLQNSSIYLIYKYSIQHHSYHVLQHSCSYRSSQQLVSWQPCISNGKPKLISYLNVSNLQAWNMEIIFTTLLSSRTLALSCLFSQKSVSQLGTSNLDLLLPFSMPCRCASIMLYIPIRCTFDAA